MPFQPGHTINSADNRALRLKAKQIDRTRDTARSTPGLDRSQAQRSALNRNDATRADNFRGRSDPRAGLIGIPTPAGPRQLSWASPEQRDFFNYGPAPLVASGGFGAAKTFGGILKLLAYADRYAGARCLIARRVNKELQQTTMKTFFKICPQAAWRFGGSINRQERTLRLNNGSEIIWTHLDDPEIEGILKGIEINLFLIDQAEEVQEEIFDILLGRLGRWDQAVVPQIELLKWEHSHPGIPWPWINPATNGPIPPSYALLACNPDVQIHWIYRRFHPDSPEHYDPKTPEIDPVSGIPSGKMLSYHDLGYRMITMPSLGNKFLPLQNRQSLLQNDKSFQHRYVHGNWGIPEGQIHDVTRLSLLEATDGLIDFLRMHCKLYRILDHGDSAPTCCLWVAADKEENIFIYREYYKPGLKISAHREGIFDLSYPDPDNRIESYTKNLADPAIFKKSQSNRDGTHWSVSDEYLDPNPPYSTETTIAWLPANNDEYGTRNRINEFLTIDPDHPHPVTKIPGAPRLYLIGRSKEYPNGCHHTYRELMAQTRVKIGTELGKPIFSDERDDSVPDHSYDCVRYFFGDRISNAPRTAADRRHPHSFDAIRDLIMKRSEAEESSSSHRGPTAREDRHRRNRFGR